jgi:glutaredoxin
VLVGLIGAGALFILSGGEPSDSEGSDIASTLEGLTSRMMPPSDDEAEGGSGADGKPGGLGRWFGRGDPADEPSNKDVYYQYVDDSGTVHFVQNLTDVPAKWQSRAGRIEVERKMPVPGGSGRRTASRAAEARKPAAYRTGPEVVVYTTTWCGWCRKTLAFLDERGVRYVNKDIEANDWHREELIEKTGRTSIPVVEIDGEIIRGFNAARMEQLLARSG